MSDGSDIEMQSALPKKPIKKMPKSPSEDILKTTSEPKKITTKEMIHNALIELKSRKGVSLQAIKKYLTEKYNVDTEKINYFIKKNIKNEVNNGSIVQVKGIGASGSFKLVEKKPEKKKKKPADSKKTKKIKKVSEKTSENPKKMKTAEEKSEKPKKVKSIEKVTENKPAKKTEATKPKSKKPSTNKKEVNKEEKKTKNKMVKDLKTPAKKKAIMMKRKSIGSIIKPPKMKPKVTKAKA